MKTTNSFGNRVLALVLSIVMVIGMLPTSVFAAETSAVAKIGDATFDTLAEAIAAVPTGTNQLAPTEATTVTLLQDTAYAFDVGTSTGATTMNLKLDLNGNTLTLSPSVGSVGTKTNGIRVLAYSKLEVTNGTVVCSGEPADNVKVGIANYGTLVLDDVELKAGNLTQYTVNNRGALKLKGNTSISSGTICAVTNDPYNLYYTSPVNASVTCDSSAVNVGSMLVERYARESANTGVVELNISAGHFGRIVEDGESAVKTDYNVTGGTIGVSNTEQLQLALSMVKAGSEYACPDKAVTIQLKNDVSGSFDVGISNGKAPKNICLDLNGQTLTLKPGIGSDGTKTNGIRVLAYSKLEVANGTVVCSDEAADAVKVAIANYSDLTLKDVAVKSGAQTIYTVNNRGNLTLAGKTTVENGQVAQGDYADSVDYVAITNDPYNLYYTSPIDAQINCADSKVSVGNILLETYGSKGDIKLNIAKGSFGGVYQPEAEGTVKVDGAITGGSFGTDVSDYCESKYDVVLEDGKYVAKYVKDDQTELSFVVPEPETTFNDNDNKYTNMVQNAKTDVTYSIISEKDVYGEEADVADINAESGELTIKMAGTVEVKAVAEGSDLYNGAEATYTLVIERDSQEGFAFETPYPVNQWTGAVFNNTASGGQGTGAVTYAITSEVDKSDKAADIADIDAQTGALTFNAVGTVTVTATKAADGNYSEAQASYTVTSFKQSQGVPVFAFEIANGSTVTVEFATGSFKNVAMGGNGTGAVTYAIVGSEDVAIVDEKTGLVTFKTAGQITVKATKAEDKDYFETTATYILVIEKSAQQDLSFKTEAPATITYSAQAQTVLPEIIGGSGEGEIKYSITSGEEIATIDEKTGAITTLKAGAFEVTVEKAGDEGYEAAKPIKWQIQVLNAPQTGFAFADKEPENITFNDNDNKFTNLASGGNTEGTITYAVDKTDVAEINATTGELTIKKAGTVTVTAIKAGDEKYLQATAQYTLTINKDEAEFSVADVNLIYGVTEYQIVPSVTLAGNGKFAYTIEGENKIGASVDETGKVTFANSVDKVGTIIIKVTKEADEQYEAHEGKTFKLNVAYHKTELRPTLTGDKTVDNNAWFVGNVTLTAPEGYQIAYANDLTGVEWEDSVKVEHEGDKAVNVYMKKGNEITDAIPFESIKIDTAAPKPDIDYTEPSFAGKLLEGITFGIYKAEQTVTVTLSASDASSGVKELVYNIGGQNVTVSEKQLIKGENGTVTYAFPIEQQLRNQVTLIATDVAGLVATTNSDHTLVVDTISPELTVSYAFTGTQDTGDVIYTNNNVTVQFAIKEDNFDLKEKNPEFFVNSLPTVLNWSDDDNDKVWTAELPLSNEGEHDLSLNFSDRSGNEMKQDGGIVQFAQKIVIDKTLPVITPEYDGAAVEGNVFKRGRTAQFSITETNFDANNVVLTVTAKDITGKAVDISEKDYAGFAKKADKWEPNGNVHTITLPAFDIDAIYTVDIAYVDLAGNPAAEYTEDAFVIDGSSAVITNVEYSTPVAEKLLEGITFGFYQAKVEVTVTAQDATSGVKHFVFSYEPVDGDNNSNKQEFTSDPVVAEDAGNGIYTATYSIDAQARGKVSVKALDYAANEADRYEDRVVVVDTVKPGLEREYTFTDNQMKFYEGVYYTKGNTKVKFTIEEANFDLSLKGEDGAAPVLTVNGEPKTVTWTQQENTDKWVAEYTLTGNGDYVVELTYTDRSGNQLSYTDDANNSVELFHEEVHIDNVATGFDISYDKTELIEANDNYFHENTTATLKLTEHNFKPDEVVLAVSAKNVTGATVDISSKAYSDYAKNPANWKYLNDQGELVDYASKAVNADEHYLVLPVFDIEASYHVELNYTDLAENAANTYTADFVVDKTAPAKVNISYSDPIVTWEQVLNAVTFGYYAYEEQVTVTLTTEDLTSGVDHFTWTYTQEAGTSASNKQTATQIIATDAITYTNDGKTATATITIPANARGYISASATDRSGNSSEETADTNRINVVDNVDPLRTVSYTPERILNAETMLDVDKFAEGDNVILYYKNAAVVTFQITEANFYKEDVVIKVNGEAVVPTDWSQNGDVWTGTITIEGNGDYVVTMTYTDRSTNKMVDYTSQKIAIDATVPTVQVVYDNHEALNTNYYKADRTATITIKAHNFRADDVKAVVTAVNVQGKQVEAPDYAAYLASRDSWTEIADDTYEAKITYSTDARYTFDIDYADIIGNAAVDYPMDEFVVDHNAPTDLNIAYSNHINVWEQVLNTVTFGYYAYEEQLEVTLTANDITSGVDYFTWTYTQEAGTSDTNKKTDTQVITTDAIAYSDNGKTATASFVIKAQARGSISVLVTDRAGNTNSKDDANRINVVDNVDPLRTVSYTTPKRILNADTLLDVDKFVEGDNVILYYEDKAVVTFQITEANFYKEDVVIKVNGEAVAPTDWKPNGDVWTGTIPIEGKGDYVVTVDYTDRSGNVMATYRSQKIAIDNSVPLIAVSYDKNEAQNTNHYKADRTATITIKAHNFRADDVKAVVTAKDILGNDVTVTDYAAYLASRDSWTETDADTYEAKITYSVDAIYTFDIDYTDIIGNAAVDYPVDEFVVDHNVATDITISYSKSIVDKVLENITFGFYQAQVQVTVTANDQTAGVDYFLITYNAANGANNSNKATYTEKLKVQQNGTLFTASHTIEAEARGTVSVKAVDKAGNESEKAEGYVVVADTVKPGLVREYIFTNGQNRFYEDVYYTQGETKVKFTITEANFDLSLKTADGETAAPAPVLTVNGEPKTVTWTQVESTDEWVAEYPLSGNGDYVVELTYTDRSTNAMETFREVVHIDNAKPVFEVTYDNNSALNSNHYKADRTATVKVTEHNFEPKEVQLAVSAKDVTGATVDISSKAYSEYAKNPENWKFKDASGAYTADASKAANADEHYLVLPVFSIDASYHVELNYTDLAENVADTYTTDFVVDHNAATDITIGYSDSIVDKILENVTFGFYKANVVVTLTANDITSGVDYFTWTYTQEAGTSTTNKKTDTQVITTDAITYSKDGKTATASFVIEAQARGSISAVVTDRAGNTSGKDDANRINVVDTVKPGLVREYTFTNGQNRFYEDVYYTQGETKVKFTITEANFDLSLKTANGETAAPAPVLTVNGEPKTVTWTQTKNTDEWVAEYTLSGNGDYVVELTYTDRSTNAMETFHEVVHIDNAKPVFEVTYDNNSALNSNHYKADRTATIKVTEHNFEPKEVQLAVSAKDVTGATVDISSKAYSEYAKNPENWKFKDASGAYTADASKVANADEHYLVLPVFSIDASYHVELNYTDLAENVADTYTTDFVVDKTVPANVNISYSASIAEKVIEAVTFGFYQADVTVTLTADDITSGVDYFTWTYTQENGTSTTNKKDDTQVITTDAITYSKDGKTATASFVIEALARGSISVLVTDRAGNTSGKDDANRINVVDNVDPLRTVSYTPERILNAETMLDVDTFAEGDNVILYYKNAAVVTFEIDEANFYKEDVVIKVNGEAVAPTDWKQNGDVWTGTITISGDGDYVVTMTYTDRSTNKMVDYTSQKIAIDATAPTVQVVYDNHDALNTNHYKADRTATITITEHNFRADDVKAVVSAVNVQGKEVEEDITDYAAYLASRGSWKQIAADTYKATITYSTDARYTFDIDYADIIGNAAADYPMDEFVVDHNAPTDLNIAYSDHINVWEQVLNMVTFGFYSYKEELVVTLTADDITSGVDYFTWTYTQEAGTSDDNKKTDTQVITTDAITYSPDGKTATASFEIDAQARGSISVLVTDRAGNTSGKDDSERINVVDNVDPLRTVSYTPERILNAETMLDVDTFAEGDNVILYYKNAAVVTFEIDEANFYKEDVVIKVNGEAVAPTDWKQNGDVWTGTITISGDGDYVVTMTYTDRSTNKMVDYTSQKIAIDATVPTVQVVYDNHDALNTNYYKADRTATITITEHNFRADDVKAVVTAVNVQGKQVEAPDYAAYLASRDSWTEIAADTYEAKITYSTDARYTFDIDYADIIGNAAVDYPMDEFVVDHNAPTDLNIAYSDHVQVWEQILNVITFGYHSYKEQLVVTLTADDITSGVDYFTWTYTQEAGTSTTNKQTETQVITTDAITYSNDGKTATASFVIDAQARGSISAVVTDRAGYTSEKSDANRINVVDNIAPTATITYNNPVQTANTISYYAGNINATIEVKESNFYSEDVAVTVTRNGANYPVNVTWVDVSVDDHTGTFTLTEDGDYIVTVKYQDRSANGPFEYTSNRLTLDTKLPTIVATNIVHNSANKNAPYGFTITANDTNLDAASFKPVLTAIVRKADGSYEKKTVSLGNMKTVEAGKTYSFTMDNLEEDAVYSLVCAVKDMSGNQYGKIALSDNVFYDEVRFSINRDGSTFAVDQNTDDLVNQYYVYSVNKDVVMEEVNVDPIENYVVKLNGQALTEGTDYISTLSDKEGEWSKRTYTIFKELFENEGEYSIVVESEDKAGTAAYSDVKSLNVSFVVDQTAPVLTISGLEAGGRYQVEAQTVTVIPTDDGGRLYSMKVIVLDSDGQPLKDAAGNDISVRFDLSGEEFLDYLTENGGIVTFTVPEGLENQVQIICNDCAVNEEGTTNAFNETYTRVTVSQSQWIIFYANKPLFYGTIAGVLTLIAGIVALIIFNKKKKAVKA